MHAPHQPADVHDLDINYITSRIAVISYPVECLNSGYCNNLNYVQKFLDSRHPEHYCVYNVSGYVYSSIKFRAKLHETGWLVKKAPPFKILVSLCKSMFLYLMQHPKNVCIVQCLDGKSASAVLVCAFLVFCKLFKYPEDAALKVFTVCRCSINMTPSQFRYIQYVSDMVWNPLMLPHKNPVVLHSVSITPIPLFNKLGDGCRPFVEVYTGEECIFTSASDSKNIRCYNSTEESISIPLTVFVTGDITIIIYHVKSDYFGSVLEKGATEKMFQVQFYSGFVSSDMQAMQFSRNELDGVEEQHRYPDDLRITIELNVISKRTEPSTLMNKVAQLNLNPWVLFSTDEEMHKLAACFRNENASGGSGTVKNEVYVYDCDKYNKGSSEDIIIGGIHPENISSVNLNPGLSLSDINVCSSSKTGLLTFLSVPTNSGFMESDSPLSNFFNASENDFLLSKDSDLLSPFQSLYATNTSCKVPLYSLNFDPPVKFVPKVHCQVRDLQFAPHGYKLSTANLADDFVTINTCDMYDNSKSSTSPNKPCVSSCSESGNVSQYSQNLLSFKDDTTAAEEQKCPDTIGSTSTTDNVSTPSVKTINSKLDPFSYLANICSSFVLLSKGKGKKEKFTETQFCENSQSHVKAPSVKKNKPVSEPTQKGDVFIEDQGKKNHGVKPKLSGNEFEDLLGSQGFSGFQRKPEVSKTVGRLRHEELVKRMDPEQLKISEWVGYKAHNIRSLLCTLHTVLWEDARWQAVGMHRLVSAADVKKYYRKACLAVHPDKQVGTKHENLARLIFMELKDAWSEFE